MNVVKQIELLCPAKDLETGRLAINYGADAVYIGAGKFGARVAAANELRDIEQLISYAHLFRAKVYITLNTILYDHELEEAEALIHTLYNMGSDALIIQDMGILEMNLPPIPLHASTQTHNYDIERIKFLDQVGFERIILARELTIDEIGSIRKQTNAELEAFVHGALCVSLSGQCYFSQAIAGRSANRGACTQACRMKFDLVDANGKTHYKDRHLLSLKDFNASAKVADMMQAGITSFKIEGRLKDKSYVINNTAYYRKLIDGILDNSHGYCKASSGSTKFSFDPDPEKTFNRGYTSYFLEGRKTEMASFESPKSKGKLVGKVNQIYNDHFLIEANEKFANGDGLCIVDENGRLQGFNLNKAEGNKLYPARMPNLKPAQEVYRNYDKDFLKLIENNKDRRKIAVLLEFSEIQHGFSLMAEDEDGTRVDLTLETEKIKADNPDQARENIVKQLMKTGDTDFIVTQVEVKTTEIYFLPASVLNQLKRQVIVALLQKRMQEYPTPVAQQSVNQVDYPRSAIDYRGNIANKLARQFYSKHSVNAIDPAFELLKSEEITGKTIMTTRYCLKYELGICPSKQTAANRLPEPLFLKDELRSYRLKFDCRNCLMKIVLDDKA
ncbi:MAG: U32 family peptidase [Bacteroidales bacterium]|nr:U32 family peptidase [Bacteroidales bacterium]